jgi:hypothetical protein
MPTGTGHRKANAMLRIRMRRFCKTKPTAWALLQAASIFRKMNAIVRKSRFFLPLADARNPVTSAQKN